MNVYEFASNPNQRRLRIEKSKMINGEFSTMDTNAVITAAQKLSHGALKLYLYLSLNADGFEFWLSKAHFCKKMNVGANTYFRAFTELENVGYISFDNYRKVYLFYDYPIK